MVSHVPPAHFYRFLPVWLGITHARAFISREVNRIATRSSFPRSVFLNEPCLMYFVQSGATKRLQHSAHSAAGDISALTPCFTLGASRAPILLTSTRIVTTCDAAPIHVQRRNARRIQYVTGNVARIMRFSQLPARDLLTPGAG